MGTLEELIDTLLKATQEGRLEWSEDRANHYSAQLSTHTVEIWYWSDPESETAGVTIQLQDKNGKILDTVQADQFSSRITKLNDMFDAARRSALNVSEVISTLEDELTSLKPNKPKTK
jgi:hypothetical protein